MSTETPVELAVEQRKVYSQLSALVASLIQSTPLKERVRNMPTVLPYNAVPEARKYRPSDERSTFAPLDLSM